MKHFCSSEMSLQKNMQSKIEALRDEIAGKPREDTESTEEKVGEDVDVKKTTSEEDKVVSWLCYFNVIALKTFLISLVHNLGGSSKVQTLNKLFPDFFSPSHFHATPAFSTSFTFRNLLLCHNCLSGRLQTPGLNRLKCLLARTWERIT